MKKTSIPTFIVNQKEITIRGMRDGGLQFSFANKNIAKKLRLKVIKNNSS